MLLVQPWCSPHHRYAIPWDAAVSRDDHELLDRCLCNEHAVEWISVYEGEFDGELGVMLIDTQEREAGCG